MKLEEIKERIREYRRDFEEKYRVKNLAIFGSYIRGEQRKESDVDILVEFTKPVSLLHIVSLENYLSDFLAVKVDVIPKKNIRKELREMILKEAIPI